MNNTTLTDSQLLNETFEWIKKAIESSTNSFHIQCCYTLIQLFELQHGASETWQYCSKLKDILLIQENIVKTL